MSDRDPSGRFGGDMDRNEVEIDLNKFMALLQEKADLKDRIRDLEDEGTKNPHQKWIFLAQAVDSWRIFPRAFLTVYIFLLYRYSPAEWLKQSMHKKVILKILFPKLNEKDYTFCSYKITPRRNNAHAYVNSAMKLCTNKEFIIR